MSVEFFRRVATVLEKAAEVIDVAEAEKTAAVKQAREGALKVVSERFTELTGEELPDAVLSKLASSDEDVLAAVQRLVEKTASQTNVEPLGSSGGESLGGQPMTKKEARQAAWDRFGQWAVSK